MNKQTRGGRPASGSSHEQRGQDDIEQEYGETERTQKDAVGGSSGESGDSGSFGSNRGDAFIDKDLEDVEQEDDTLLAGGRKDVESQQQRQGGKFAEGSSEKPTR